MITGKDSALKFGALLAIVLAGALALIFGTSCVVVEWINSLLVAGTMWWGAYYLYQRWKDR